MIEGERAQRIPWTVWALGIVSLLMDVSSEMIHALLPLYLVTALGASALTVGVIEGVAEATASITKVFSGALSDWMGRRKLLTVIGYGVATVTKPVFALATSIGPIVGARFLDRVGKGIRGAPRDALIADVTPAHLRGAAFGLRQSLDTVGAFIGPLAAIALMAASSDDFRAVFWVATVPAVAAMVVLVLGVQEPAHHAAVRKPRPRLQDVRRMGRAFWAVTVVGFILTLARFSEAFLVLRARDVGVALAVVPMVLVVMNVAYSLSAYPAGALSDRLGRRVVIVAGLMFLVASDLVLAYGDSIPVMLGGVTLWGLHMGFTQGLFATLIADTAPAELRGSAFGLFNLGVGIAMLAASVIAGALWTAHGSRATFLAGAAFTAVALSGILALPSFAAPMRDRQ